jgi:hypothetical protein
MQQPNNNSNYYVNGLGVFEGNYHNKALKTENGKPKTKLAFLHNEEPVSNCLGRSC